MCKQLCQLKWNGLSYLCSSAQRTTTYSRYTTERFETVIQSSETRLSDGEIGCGSGHIETSAAFGYFLFPHFLKKKNKHGIINVNTKLGSSYFYQAPKWILMQIRLKFRHHNSRICLMQNPCSRSHHHCTTRYCWETHSLPRHTLMSW